MSLHYLVKLEMIIAHTELLEKKTLEFIPPQPRPRNSPLCGAVIQSAPEDQEEQDKPGGAETKTPKASRMRGMGPRRGSWGAS